MLHHIESTQLTVGWATFGCGTGSLFGKRSATRFGSLGGGFGLSESAVAAALCRRTPKVPRVAYPSDSSVSLARDGRMPCKVWLPPPTTDQFIGMLMTPNAEQQRLNETKSAQQDWKRWGPYLSERQWGTVREDYSPHGNAWEYLPHDHARSRAYRWGEDGIAGISDDQQRLCLSLALWNGKDPILKERIFGLTNGEGNHGEDAKELYYYLDATPTHSYLKMLYKYPQREFPYAQLVEENGRRKGDSSRLEFELLDAGIFDDDRYFDVFVEYAKASPEDILMRVTVHNRGPRKRPFACCRNCGFATPGRGNLMRRSRNCPPVRTAQCPSRTFT